MAVQWRPKSQVPRTKYIYATNKMNQNPSYQNLINVLKRYLKETQRIDFTLTDREHCLKCLECGAHERQSAGAGRYVCGGDGKELSYASFITLDGYREAYMKSEEPWIRTTYEYICPDCGVWLREHFEERLNI